MKGARTQAMIGKIFTGFRFFLYKFLLPACGFFTLFVVLLYLLPDTKYLTKDKIFVLLFAAAGIAAINLVLFLSKISIYFRVATHFIGLTVLLLGVLWLSGYMNRTDGNWVLILVAFAMAYAIVCPIVLILRAVKLKKKKEEKPTEYQPKFK